MRTPLSLQGLDDLRQRLFAWGRASGAAVGSRRQAVC